MPESTGHTWLLAYYPGAAASLIGCSSVTDRRFYDEVVRELEEGRADKGLMAKCYAEAGGDDNKARAQYMRERARQLASEQPDGLPRIAGPRRRGERPSTEATLTLLGLLFLMGLAMRGADYFGIRIAEWPAVVAFLLVFLTALVVFFGGLFRRP